MTAAVGATATEGAVMSVKASALVSVGVFFAATAFADVAVQQVGFQNGDDWEPAVAADGQNVYMFWPHIGAVSGTTDSSGAVCTTQQTGSYMYLQRSSDGGVTWSSPIVPRCPVFGTQVDAQIVIGPNHRVYAAYMDGPNNNSSIQVIYSDDFGVTWSAPVNAANSSGGGDKDILLVDSSGGVLVTYEHLSNNYVAYTPNLATTPFTQTKIGVPAAAKSGTSLATGGILDTKGNAYFAMSDATNNAKSDTYLWLARSSDHFKTYQSLMVDRSAAAPSKTGAGWDYWGASIQIAAIPRPTMATDRLVVIYNAGAVAGGAERIYSKYSDDNGTTWSVPYNPNVYPNGTALSAAPQGAWHGFPAIAATTAGVKVIWQDNRVQYPCVSSSTPGQCGLWNTYTSVSADGATFGPEDRMALTYTQPYQVATPAPGGFYHPYGDYAWMSTDGQGNFVATWGEGSSYNGPGTIYFAKF
jgi:hypothetical protein